MAKYNVTLPFAGYVTIEIEADSEEQAIESAQENAELSVNSKGETKLAQWEFYEKILEGNIYYVDEYEASAELIEEEED